MATNRTAQALARLADLTPRQIVAELDRYIVGQADAKKAVAIALRNRWRRQRAPDNIRAEIAPNNIILIGPTGVGKTEIARRLAKLAGAPFVKVEASKFTEVGYVGRDVEGMVRDLVDSAIDMVRTERESEVEDLRSDNIRAEIAPNNIILIGPTGVGKTEIARRLAKLAGAPFVKVEASKFTEVGYVGRDVEGMVRDLVDSAIDMVRTERESEVEDLAQEKVEERLLDLLLPPPDKAASPSRSGAENEAAAPPAAAEHAVFVV